MSCGLNSAAVLLAHALGAHSVFTASGKERIARVTALGGTVGVDYREEDFLVIQVDFTYSMELDLIKIVDLNHRNRSVTNDIENVPCARSKFGIRLQLSDHVP